MVVKNKKRLKLGKKSQTWHDMRTKWRWRRRMRWRSLDFIEYAITIFTFVSSASLKNGDTNEKKICMRFSIHSTFVENLENLKLILTDLKSHDIFSWHFYWKNNFCTRNLLQPNYKSSIGRDKLHVSSFKPN